jgi:hypothetical protein
MIVHTYEAELLQRAHVADLQREAAQSRLAAQLPQQPGLQHWAATQFGLLLIRGGKRLTLYGRQLNCAWNEAS